MQTTDILTRRMVEQLPNYKKQTEGEYSAACPFCKEGEDRFRFWPERGNFWCRRCGTKGFVGDAPRIQLDPDALARWRDKEQERQRRAKLNQCEKIERLNQSDNASRYHHQLIDRSWWYAKGLNDRSIDQWQLGYTTNCPTAPGQESYTIPVYFGEQLFNIRHRLVCAKSGNKYRPEMAGLPAVMFNADVLHDDSGFVTEVVLVEGEIKAMVLQQHGFDTVGIPGANSFKEKWIDHFTAGKLIYVAMDPGAHQQGRQIWQILGEAGVPVRLCRFPVKPDDFFVIYGGSMLDFYSYLRLGSQYRQ